MLKKSKYEKIITCCFFLTVFLFCFLFFTKINPIMIFDTDDWTYIRYSRPALPIWGDWNPCRVLPETLMSLCSSFGVFVVNPFLNNYIFSLTISFAMVVSCFICIYLYCFYRLSLSKFNCPFSFSVFLTLFFFVCHFWVFRHNDSNNEYLFRANDACCYFYYIIPALLNASIVLYLLRNNKYCFKNYKSSLKLSILILSIYFCVFSNLFQTSILISFFSFIILKTLIENKGILLTVKKAQIPIFGVLLWLFSLPFEVFGGRSQSGLTPQDFDLIGSLKNFIYNFHPNKLNAFFVIFSILLITASIVLLIINHKNNKNSATLYIIIISLFCILYVSFFNIIICAKVGSTYIQRSDILICVFFYIFLFISALLSFFSNIRCTKILMPMVLVIICSFIITGNRTFKESNYANLNSDTVLRINNYIVEEIMEANNNGVAELKLSVPKFESEDNWPLTDTYGGNRVSEALYYHHIINNAQKTNVIFVPDNKINEEFGILTIE